MGRGGVSPGLFSLREQESVGDPRAQGDCTTRRQLGACQKARWEADSAWDCQSHQIYVKLKSRQLGLTSGLSPVLQGCPDTEGLGWVPCTLHQVSSPTVRLQLIQDRVRNVS